MANASATLSTGLLLALMLGAAPVLAQSENIPPAQVASDDASRFFVDTPVTDIIIDETMTVAILNPLDASPCASDQYVFERERPKWLNTTGRLLQAQKENALMRISFSCISGYQSINAIQFLSPPAGLITTEPRASQVIRTTPRARELLEQRRSTASFGDGSAMPRPATTRDLAAAPEPTNTVARTERLRAVPLPAQPAPAAAPAQQPIGGAPAGDNRPYLNERVRGVPLP